MTTVELVVDTALAEPRHRRQAPHPIGDDYEAILQVRIGFEETALRQRVKAAGRRWLPEHKVRALCREDVNRLADRMVRRPKHPDRTVYP
jgi:hypothetical protein